LMGRYAAKRLLQAVPLLALVSLISFCIIKLVPGDPAVVMAGPAATPQDLEHLRQTLGLDKPFATQLTLFYLNLLQADLGRSLMLGTPVTDAIVERTPATLAIAAYSLVLTLLVGLATGVLAALRHNTWVDQALSTFALLGVSLPNFWLGLVMIVLFSVYL